MKLAICLAGGGIKGAAHIGFLKAIEEEKIKYDYITGTSSGSIVASLSAMGYKSNEIYELFKKYCKKIKYIDWKHIAKIVFGITIKRSIIVDGLNSGEIIEELINEAARKKHIYNINQIKTDLLIPSVDLNDGSLYMFSSVQKRGAYSDEIKYIYNINIGKAVRASCSYPGFFSPCEWNNKELIDGGIRENLPWKEAKVNGADKVLCVKFENKKKTKCKKNIIDVITNSMDILHYELSNYEVEGADYLLTFKTDDVSLLDCSKLDYLYQIGYKEGKEFLKENFKNSF